MPLYLFLASEKYVDYFHLFAFCDGFQTGLESQGWQKKHLTYLHFFLQFTLDKYYNKILQLFYFCKKTLLDEVQASEARGTVSYSVWHEKQNIFFSVFSWRYVLCSLYVRKHLSMSIYAATLRKDLSSGKRIR